MPGSEPQKLLLDARGVDVAYNGKAVVRGVSVEARAGRVTGIVGPNGSGKTTLLRAMAGLVATRAGEVLLDGRSVSAYAREDVARRIALVLQETAVPFDILVDDVVAMGRAPHQRPFQLDSSNDLKVVAAALDRAGASHLRGRDFNEISAGERQRVSIARALAQEPAILLLDEPTSHLDVAAALEVMGMLRMLALEGMAVVAVVHDLGLAARYCDEVLVMSEGECAARGPPERVLTPAVLAKVFRATFIVQEIGGVVAVVAHEPAEGTLG